LDVVSESVAVELPGMLPSEFFGAVEFEFVAFAFKVLETEIGAVKPEELAIKAELESEPLLEPVPLLAKPEAELPGLTEELGAVGLDPDSRVLKLGIPDEDETPLPLSLSYGAAAKKLLFMIVCDNIV